VPAPLCVADLERIAYDPALAIQQRLVQRVKADPKLAYLLLLEHDPPVITLGRRGDECDILLPREEVARRGIEVFESSRGGEVTYHGPGQLVGYAILHLDRRDRNVRGHVRNLEETLIRVLAGFGITAGRREGFTGVWVGEEKIAAIGVAVHRWVSYHGFALNVTTDLGHFDLIVPCGIRDKTVTSMQELLGAETLKMEQVKAAVVERFREVYEFETLRRIEAGELE
jgi:lipoate-protein ligase B